ncbi:MAG: ParA family protein [Nanoarchaeota archaeon]|nr:ParA family protein [Nanoarchaeota archaeon]
MRKIAIINQKGGVGKTTTAINLAAGLAKRGFKVLILDLDGQGNISTALNINAEKDMYSMLVEKQEPESCMTEVRENISVIPSNDTLEKAEVIMSGQPSRETILKRALQDVRGFDYILLDCPPSLSILNQNALLYADEAFIPASTDFLGLDALRKMLKEIDTINNVFSHECDVTMIIPTMFDGRNKTCKEHHKLMKTEFNGIPISEPIRINSKLKEMPKSGKTIFEYANSSRGAQDYKKLVDLVAKQKVM